MVFKDFATFLVEKNIFNLMISTIIGTAVSGLVAELIKQLVKPVTKTILKPDSQVKIKYFGTDLRLDEIINKTVEFLFILMISFLIFRLID